MRRADADRPEKSGQAAEEALPPFRKTGILAEHPSRQGTFFSYMQKRPRPQDDMLLFPMAREEKHIGAGPDLSFKPF